MGDVPRICQWYWSCCHFWQLIPGMNNKIIIILHQREDDQFVKSIKNWAKDCPLMRWSASGRPCVRLLCHRYTKGPGGRGYCNAGRQGGLSWMHIYILSLISCREEDDKQNTRVLHCEARGVFLPPLIHSPGGKEHYSPFPRVPEREMESTSISSPCWKMTAPWL